MNSELNIIADNFFVEEVGFSLEQLLAPISPEQPVGESLRAIGGHESIKEARREDDPSIPQGAWQHDLKRADWSLVSSLCVQALTQRSKDMQLVAWLMEAQLHKQGFSALAPCLTLMQCLCERYWDSLHPCIESDDKHEARANIILWLNTYLLPPLRQIPIAKGSDSRPYSWCDWGLAHHYDQSRSNGGLKGEENELSVSVLSAALAVTASEDIQQQVSALAAASSALAELGLLLDGFYTQEAPSLSSLREMLLSIHATLEGELVKRGHLSAEDPLHSDTSNEDPAIDHESPSGTLTQAIADRAEAYASLQQAAEFLLRLEPHSPVPYLVIRAIEWGRLDTVDLYQELFVRMSGQLSIFDLLGLVDDGEGK